MTQESVERLIGRLLTDDQLLIRTKTDLALACQQEGYILSNEELALVRHTDFSLLSAAAYGLDSGIKRAISNRSNS